METMEKIDIRDLSLGDWVYHDDIVFGREIAKVHRLNNDKNCETIGITVYRSDGAFGVVGYILTSPTNNDIHPIPLTREILEKNGFVYSRVTRWYKCELKDTQRTTIGVHYGLIGADRIEISSVDAFDEDWNTIDVMINKPIKGVHQLQHALRLAGVEKEIIMI